MTEREGNEGSMESTHDLGRMMPNDHVRAEQVCGTSPSHGETSAMSTPTLQRSGAEASEQREQIERHQGGVVGVAEAAPMETNEHRSGAELLVTANTEEDVGALVAPVRV